MLTALGNLFREWLPRSPAPGRLALTNDPSQPPAMLKPIGFDEFRNLNVPRREMLLDPILPERSLAMLYAPRGVGKTLLGLSIGLAVASGTALLRWSAPRKRRVLVVDGEMPLVSLQERL
jgi:putative DNA primase/helicase